MVSGLPSWHDPVVAVLAQPQPCPLPTMHCAHHFLPALLCVPTETSPFPSMEVAAAVLCFILLIFILAFCLHRRKQREGEQSQHVAEVTTGSCLPFPLPCCVRNPGTPRLVPLPFPSALRGEQAASLSCSFGKIPYCFAGAGWCLLRVLCGVPLPCPCSNNYLSSSSEVEDAENAKLPHQVGAGCGYWAE